MKLLSKDQAQELDRIAINELGIPGIDLMGNAGKAIAEHAQKMVADISNPKIAIFCGKGNNAGDGYKAALELITVGIRIEIFRLFSESEIQGDSLYYYNKCVTKNITIKESVKPPKEKYDLIIDALLGTGFVGELRPPFSSITKWINSQPSLKLAIDIPSGIDANSGTVAQNAIKANSTITMGFSKVGMELEPAKSYCGDIIPVDIGFPKIYDELTGFKFRKTDKKIVQKYLVAPSINTHKHKQGKVLIVAGSRGMTGAAILASLGAIRSGAGLVTTFAPASLSNIYETKIVEGLSISCEDEGKGYFTEMNYSGIEKFFDWADALLIGPGLGKNESTIKLVKKIISNFTKPLVIDADGLNYFYKNDSILKKLPANTILTPHYGEFARMLKNKHFDIHENIIEHIQNFMHEFEGALVVKNAPTIISTGNEIIINTSGNQGLATGGTGDVLSGVIASFLAQGIPSSIAAEVGVYIHGKSAEIVSQKKGLRGLIASDLIEKLPQSIKQYE